MFRRSRTTFKKLWTPDAIKKEWLPDLPQYDGTTNSRLALVAALDAPKVFTKSDKNLLKTIKSFPLEPGKDKDVNPVLPKQDTAKFKKGKKTMVLDLDETIFDPSGSSWMYSKNDASEKSLSSLRPHHKMFLEAAQELFEVIVWTRSGGEWPQRKCDLMGLKPEHMLTGWGDCDDEGRKALWKVGRSPDQVFLIDDDFSHWTANPRSQILIPGWSSNSYSAGKHDDYLLLMIPLLEKIARSERVQDVLDDYTTLLFRPDTSSSRKLSQ